MMYNIKMIVGDMSPDVWMQVVTEDDGDAIVTINDNSLLKSMSIQFCTSGCRSTHTIKALKNLMASIEIDNQLR